MGTPHDPIVVIGAGQSGLVAAHKLREHGVAVVVLDAAPQPAGAWPNYYDSLTLFSPARYSELPGHEFPGDPERYPTRDETVAYLESYAARLDADIRLNTRVSRVERAGRGFTVHTADGTSLRASGLVAASGAYTNPVVPTLPGQAEFTGRQLHAADYREPKAHSGERVVVVGGGNSAAQIGYELAEHARVTLATLQPLEFLTQRPGGHDVHYWSTVTGFDQLPPAWLAPLVPGPLVSDDGTYSRALSTGVFDRRPMFEKFGPDGVEWPNGTYERIDTVLFATGYRPSVDYLRPLGALDETDYPLHTGGISTTHPGLVYLGLEFQRSFASNTLRGVARDADHVIAPLLAYVRDAPAALGL